MRSWPTKTLALGGDYNPEQWPRPVWDEDIEAIQRANISFVSLGIFSWKWLERTGQHCVRVARHDPRQAHAAASPSTSRPRPPPRRRGSRQRTPRSCPSTSTARTLWPGSRQTWCPTSPVFRDDAVALTRERPRATTSTRLLAMWHVSNEYACHNLPCYCDECARHFRTWLQRRYVSLDVLNDAWAPPAGASATPTGILPRNGSTTFNNPTHMLDYKRFSSDALLEHMRASARPRRALSRRAGDDEVDDARPLPPATSTTRSGRPPSTSSSTDHYIVDVLRSTRPALAYSSAMANRGSRGRRPSNAIEHFHDAVN